MARSAIREKKATSATAASGRARMQQVVSVARAKAMRQRQRMASATTESLIERQADRAYEIRDEEQVAVRLPLAGRQDLAQAILYSEVFGQPRALRAWESRVL
jgi:hypothetical protein